MVLRNHGGGEFLHLKNKKPFDIQGYKMFIPYLDMKKLASHPYPYVFVLVCYEEHWWIWMTDVKKRKFHVIDPYHKTCPLKERMKLNRFVVSYVISRMRVFVGGQPLVKRDD
ncbi:hypothetical protein Ahy_A08g039869 [Arachis hypogaea]|uniref:Ubiquitin-like protease family profile domain-containing protein n=1 Tax=Arachis hypogaea TaxID=3818 RepID=A0A445BXJ5_ARAHY|nr:hypothetical protein Ahy_A08g039869 [Arachis hypogaea]